MHKPNRIMQAEALVYRRLPELYALLAFAVTLSLVLLTPPFFVPDEMNHSMRAIQIGMGQIIATNDAMGAGGQTDRNAHAVMGKMSAVVEAAANSYPTARSRPDGRISRSELAAVQKTLWAHGSERTSFPNTAVYPPPLYLPQAAGWDVARYLNLSIIHSLTLARLFAALSAVLTGWLALRQCACVRPLLFAILLLPTCLSLNASTSQDAMLFSVASLALAILSAPLMEGRQFRTWELCGVAIMLACCIGARVPYLPMVLLLFLPWLNVRDVAPRMMRGPLLAACAVILCVVTWQWNVRTLGVSTGPGANIAAQRAFIHSHPVWSSLVIIRATIFDGPLILLKGFAWLGTNVLPPLWEYALLVLALCAAVLLARVGCLRTWPARVLLLFALFGTAAGMSLAEYLIWSLPGAAHAGGLQSRYYLPLLPFLMLMLPGRSIVEVCTQLRRIVSASAYMVILGCVSTLPWLAAHRFYNASLVVALREVCR